MALPPMGAGPGPMPPGKKKPPLADMLGQMMPPQGQDYGAPPGMDDIMQQLGGMPPDGAMQGSLPTGAMPPGMAPPGALPPGVTPTMPGLDQSSALQQMLGGMDAAAPVSMPVQSSIQENREYLAAMLIECYPGMDGATAHALLTQIEASPESILGMPPDSPGRKVLDLIGDLGAQPPMQPSIMG